VAVLDNDMRVLTICRTPSFIPDPFSASPDPSNSNLTTIFVAPLHSGILTVTRTDPYHPMHAGLIFPRSTVCNNISSCGPLARGQGLRNGISLRSSFCGCDQHYRVTCGLTVSM
jgi:hypothetical protein